MTDVDARIQIIDYKPDWPEDFRRERAALEPLLAPWLVAGIEHVGSTAVPGLAAKPVIDIMAPVASLDAARDAIGELAALDYHYAPYKADVMHWLCKPSPARRTHHLHLVEFESPLWHERLAFRDALRGDPGLAADYARLKRALAAAHPGDRDRYTQGKTVFIAQVGAE